MHSFTGQKKIFDLNFTFENCGNYSMVQLIETVKAELVQKMREVFSLLIIPENDENQVTTYYWLNNFDVKKKKY